MSSITGPDPLSDSVLRSDQLLGKPVERTNEIGLEMISLVRSIGFPEADYRIARLSQTVARGLMW